VRVRVGSSRDLVIRNNQLGRDYCIQLIFYFNYIMYYVKMYEVRVNPTSADAFWCFVERNKLNDEQLSITTAW